MHSQRLNRAANEAAEENKKAYKKWVESYTPMQIREANNARRQLKAKLVNYNKGQIQDDRAVATPASAYIIFFKERYATGEFKNMSTTEAAKLVGAEWKALSASSKEVRSPASQTAMEGCGKTPFSHFPFNFSEQAC